MQLNNDKITTALGIIGGVVQAITPVFAGESLTPTGIITGILIALFGYFTNRQKA